MGCGSGSRGSGSRGALWLVDCGDRGRGGILDCVGVLDRVGILDRPWRLPGKRYE